MSENTISANSATNVITKHLSGLQVDDRKREQMVSQLPRNSAVEYGKRCVTEKLLDMESQSIFADPVQPSFAQKRILCVDDNVPELLLRGKILELQGYTVVLPPRLLCGRAYGVKRFFPAGYPHSIQGLGPGDGCQFLLVFDEGMFSLRAKDAKPEAAVQCHRRCGIGLR